MLWGVLLWGLATPVLMHASDELFPIPDPLRPNVYFWKKVFAEIDMSGGILHDISDLSIIYETLQELPSNSSERQSTISGYRDYYQAILMALAEGKRTDLSHDEARVLAMFKGNANAGVLSSAAANMRFQGGMREKFMRGIVRSGAHIPDIERIFAAAGLPTELAYLPHVESSFENRALSKVGAAGIWQIMPATGRRYLTVNGRVDERLNVPVATTAAAQILQENYEQLGTWPLAVTAYNHGLYGMKQAVETMGTTDFGIIFQYYRGPSFGFASQNFYAEFVAALDVARNYKRYFGDIDLSAPVSFITTVRQQRDNDRSDEPPPPLLLNVAPPLLREPPAPEPDTYAQKPVPPVMRQVRDSSQDEKAAVMPPPPVVPRQEKVVATAPPPILPRQEKAVAAALPPVVPYQEKVVATALPPVVPYQEKVVAAAPPPVVPRQEKVVAAAPPLVLPRQAKETSVHEQHAAAPESGRTYRVQPGDTLMAIARQFHTTTAQLSALNNFSPRYMVKTGETVAIAAPTPPPAEKTASQVVAKATVRDIRQPVIEAPVNKVRDNVTPKAGASKAAQSTPSQPPAAKPTSPTVVKVVALASAPQGKVAKKTAPEPVNPARTRTAKTSSGKPAPSEATKPVVASATKAATGKVVTKGRPVETSKAAGVSTTKVTVTKVPVLREEPKATPVNTRVPIRRPNTKGV